VDGAKFHIVLVDETTTSTATSDPVRHEAPPRPAPARPDPAPPSTSPAPSPTKTDRPASVADTRATPANEQADRAPTTSKKTPEESSRDKHLGAVKEATKIIVDSSHLAKSFQPILETISQTRKVFDGALAAVRLYQRIADRANDLALKRDSREPPKTQTKADKETPVTPQPAPQSAPQPTAASKPELATASKLEREAEVIPPPPQPAPTKPDPILTPDPAPTKVEAEDTPDAFLFPEERPTKPEPVPTPDPAPTKVKAEDTPDAFLFPEEKPTKPDPSPTPEAKAEQKPAKPQPSTPEVKAEQKPAKPEPSKQPDQSWWRSMLDSMIGGLAKLFDEPGMEPVKQDTDSDPALKAIDANTDPSHIANAATRIVSAIEGTAEAEKKDAAIRDDSGNAIEDLHNNSIATKATKTGVDDDEWMFDEFNIPYKPDERKPNHTAQASSAEDEFLFGEKEENKSSGASMPDIGTINQVAKAVEGGEAGAAAETAAVAEAATAGEAAGAAAGAAEGAAALEAGATRAAGGLARLAAAMGPPGWAAAAVAVSLASVAAAGYLVYKAFDKIGDAAAKQADELEGYSADIAKQRAETDVRRQMRLIDRAQERGATLARVGETKDRLDEAINNLKDVVTDRFVDLGERMIPLIEMLIDGINTTSNVVEAIGSSSAVIEATIIDWLNLLGDEAKEDALWREKWEQHSTTVGRIWTKHDRREEEKNRRDKGDPMMDMLVNAFGPPQAIDPAVMKQLVEKMRAL